MHAPRYARLGAISVIAATVTAFAAHAASVTVISTLNVMPAFMALQHGFEARTGDKLIFQRQGAKATEALVERGTQADIVVGSRPMLERLLADGKLKPGSIRDFARSSLGVFVKAGSPRPDISTDDKFRQMLLDAPSIVYPDPAEGSLGGNYLADLLGHWGLAAQLGPKTTLADGGADAGTVVAQGKARIGINQIAEVQMVPGLTFLSPLPPALTDKVVMSVAISAYVRQPRAAQAWIASLSSPAAAQAIRKNGMTPD